MLSISPSVSTCRPSHIQILSMDGNPNLSSMPDTYESSITPTAMGLNVDLICHPAATGTGHYVPSTLTLSWSSSS